jgi:hypothetical protein
MSEDIVAMRLRHGKDEIGVCGDRPRELSRGKIGCLTTQLFEYACGIRLYRVPCQRVGTGARCF